MLEVIKRGFKKSWGTYIALIKIIIPVYVGVALLKYLGVINYISHYFSPLMKFVGLPGEAVLALLTGYFLNIYGAIAVIGSLDLGVGEVSILGTMIGLSHSLIIEGAILKRIGVKVIPLTILRIFISILAGVFLNIML